jgi:tetratricopeptide (TPR) repeat protein
MPSSILLVALMITLVSADDKPCKSSNDVEQYWKAHQQEKALECLNNLMRADPEDPRMHLLKGEYCLSQGNFFCAKEQFNIKSVKSKYAVEIADLYKKEADYFYHEAALLNPAVRIGIVKKSFEDNKQALGLFHLDEAKKWAIRPGFEIVTDEHKKFARKYLGDAEVKKELPEVITLTPRKRAYEFALKKGEQTGSWIAWNEKTTTHLHFFQVNNDKYEVHYKNGDRVRVWAGEQMPKIPDDQFKIVAIEDTTVLIAVD